MCAAVLPLVLKFSRPNPATGRAGVVVVEAEAWRGLLSVALADCNGGKSLGRKAVRLHCSTIPHHLSALGSLIINAAIYFCGSFIPS